MATTNTLKIPSLLIAASLALVSISAQAQVKIMAVGDSITEGFTADPPAGTGLGTASYRQEFENLLNQSNCSFEMVGSRRTNARRNPLVFTGDHEGYSGHTADNFVTGRAPNPGIDASMAEHTPDVVLLHLGSNDMFQGQNIQETVLEIEDVVSRILNANGNAKILVANVIPWFGDSNSDNSDIPGSIQTLGTQITTAIDAMGNPNVILTDVRSGYTQSLMQADGVHPNADGEVHIADAFAAALDTTGICAQFGSDNFIPDTFIDTPVAGGSVFKSARFSGTATDLGGSGFDRVNIAIQRTSDRRWLNFVDGGFGPISIGAVEVGITTANLTNTSLSSTDWSFNTFIQPGSYRLLALAVDNAGNDAFHGSGLSEWPVSIPFNVVADEIAPTGTITSPAANGDTVAPSTILMGTADDDIGGSGVATVQIAIRTLGQNSQWYDFDGGFSANRVRVNAILSNNNWTLPVSLPPDDYRLHMRVIDGDFNNSGSIDRDFTVPEPDTIDPTGTVDNPAANGDSVAPNTTLTGTASDTGGSGVANVQIGIRTLGQNIMWFDSNGNSFQDRVLTTANLSNGDWTLPLPGNLPTDTNLRLHMLVTDGNGNNSGFISRNFTIAVPDTIDPTGTVDNPAANGDSVAPGTTLTGTASDTGGSGVATVQIGIRTLGQNIMWFDSSGNSFQDRVLNTANLSNGNWTFTLPGNLPTGTNLRLHMLVTDGNGNNSGFSSRNFTIAVPDTIDPTGTVANPAANGDSVAPGATLMGTASDNTGGSGVATVQIGIRTLGQNVMWFDSNGNSFQDRVLTTANFSNGNWTLQLPGNLPTNTNLRLHMLVTDGNGNNSGFINRNFTVQ